jgi:hypothetical protein
MASKKEIDTAVPAAEHPATPAPLAEHPLAEVAAALVSQPLNEGIVIGPTGFVHAGTAPEDMPADPHSPLVQVKLGKNLSVHGFKSKNREDGKKLYLGGETAILAKDVYAKNPHLGLMWDEEQGAWVQLRSKPNHPYNLTAGQQAAIVEQQQRLLQTIDVSEVPPDPTGEGAVLQKTVAIGPPPA